MILRREMFILFFDVVSCSYASILLIFFMVVAAFVAPVTRYLDMSTSYQLLVLGGVKERGLRGGPLFSFSFSLRSFD